MVLAAVAIPGLGVVSRVLNPALSAGWGMRAGLAACCVGLVVMGRGPLWLARWMPLASGLSAVNAMIFFAWRMHEGNMTPTHMVAFEMLVVLPLMVMRQPVAHLSYSAVALGLAGSAYVGLDNPGVPLFATLTTLLVLSVGTSVASLSRARAEAALVRSRAELEDRVEERTEQLRAEVTERRAAEADAVRANRAKSSFLATMSHELRTPLNAIIGYTELVQDELAGLPHDGTEELVEDLHRVRHSADHLLRMVADVLDLSQVEAGELTVETADLDVAEQLADLERLASSVLKRSEASFRVDVEPGLWVHTDPARLSQIVLNLVTNALKFTASGEVVVSATRDSAGHMMLEVRDTGVGIAPDDLERVFQSFVQVDGSSTRKRDGVGLGLALSKDLAQRLGGTLTARSQLGEGSVFTLRLPGATLRPAGQ